MKYLASYDVRREDPPASGEEIREKKRGGCDAVVLHSILFQEDGGRSEVIVSMDGRTGEQLPAVELFKSWAMMTFTLSKDERLSEAKRGFCASVHEAIAQALRKAGEEI